MKLLLSQIIFIGLILAIYFIIGILRKREWKYRENRLFVTVCFFSAIWSFGFWGVIIQTDPQKAYLWRAIGMVGTFGYLISAQYLICYLSGAKRFFCRMAEGFSLLGILIFFFVIQKKEVTYELSRIGMTYSFTQSLWNTLYIWYTVIVAVNQCIFIVQMIKNPKVQRLRELGKKLLAVEAGMVFGMLLDTVFPVFGQPAIPGSTIGQFVGLTAMYHSILFVNHSRITINNMSEFIYYSLNVPVLVYDSKERMQVLNDAAFSFLGIHKEQMEEISIDSLFTITQGEVFEFEDNSQSIDTMCFHNDKDCNLTVNKIHDDYGDIIGYIIVVTDLSERIKAMKQLEEAMKEAEYANQAKSIFLANMSHEIRTPMNAIIGFSELLLKMDINDEIRSHVQDIKWSSHNLLAIINDILDISKIESGKMELIPDVYYTARLLNDVVLIIEPQAQKKGLQFKIKVDETIPKQLYGDKVRVRGILINILNNAVKYTREGSITFEVFTVLKAENKIKLAFRVTDTGMGIKEENLGTLFDNFERLDQKVHYGVEGSGLGLAIAKGHVGLMGGEIKVSSRYGEGSVFTVEIEQEIIDGKPMEKEDIFGSEVSGSAKKNGFKIQNMRVLVVDDNPINLKVAHGILSTYELEVDTALSGEKAIELCKNRKYSIVFMDQMMQGIDGIQAMREIRSLNDHYALHGGGKIIVLTANAIKGTREMLIQQGFDEYLGKPLNIERLEILLCKFIPKENIIFEDAELVSNVSVQYEEIKKLEEMLNQIDVNLGISHCGGEVDSYLKVLEITYKYGEKQLQELNHLWEEKEYRNFTIKVHSLKSTALSLGAKKVSEEARRQEEASIKGEYGYVEKNIKRLTTDYMDILQEIQEVLVHYGILSAEQEAETDKPKLDERMLLHMFRTIEQHIDAFDFAKVFTILEETKKYKIPQQYEEILLKIEELMEELSVEEVKELLHTIRYKL